MCVSVSCVLVFSIQDVCVLAFHVCWYLVCVCVRMSRVFVFSIWYACALACHVCSYLMFEMRVR